MIGKRKIKSVPDYPIEHQNYSSNRSVWAKLAKGHVCINEYAEF